MQTNTDFIIAETWGWRTNRS